MNIKQLRKDKHLTQQALADMLGVTTRTISAWENGQPIPNGKLGMLHIIADGGDTTIHGDNNTSIHGGSNNRVEASNKLIEEVAAQRKLTEKALEEVAAQRKLAEMAMAEMAEQRKLTSNSQMQLNALLDIVKSHSK